jgi:hypothetical protein
MNAHKKHPDKQIINNVTFECLFLLRPKQLLHGDVILEFLECLNNMPNDTKKNCLIISPDFFEYVLGKQNSSSSSSNLITDEEKYAEYFDRADTYIKKYFKNPTRVNKIMKNV